MRLEKADDQKTDPETQTTDPETLHELQSWVRQKLHLPAKAEAALFAAVDAVFSRHQRLWRDSKQDAVQALSTGFAEKMARARHELRAKDATVSTISQYFEELVDDLTDKSHRDPKTKLMNLAHFMQRLESFLALEQRGRWCAVGLVDIANFKGYNDTLGHQVGDRIIECVARLLREQARSDDLIAQEPRGKDSLDAASRDLHARFGGDEFCFLISDLDDVDQAYAIGERFRTAVADHEWGLEYERLAANPPRADVGMVCLWLGRMEDRRFRGAHLAAALIQRADQLMYDAKSEHSTHVRMVTAKVVAGQLMDASAESLG